MSQHATIKIVFSEAMRGLSGQTVRLVDTRTGTAVVFGFHYDAAAQTATLTPQKRMLGLTRYKVVIRRGITDLAGNMLRITSWTFTTR